MLSELRIGGPLTLLVALVFVAACADDGGDEAPPNGSSSSAETAVATETPGEVIRIEGGSPPVWFADSLRTMVERYQTVIVGRVEGVREVRNLGAQPRTENAPPKLPETVFDVSVLEVISASRISPGDTIGFYQVGALGPGGSYREGEPNPLVNIGTTYLFFLRDLQPFFRIDEFTSAEFGRFVIKDGLVMPNGSDGLVGVGAVSGVTREEALAARYSENPEGSLEALARTTVAKVADRIKAAIAEAQLPPLETPPSTEPAETSAPDPTAPGSPTPAPSPDESLEPSLAP
jgi:hypothetical protein